MHLLHMHDRARRVRLEGPNNLEGLRKDTDVAIVATNEDTAGA